MAQFTVTVTARDGIDLFTQVESVSQAQAQFAARELKKFAATKRAEDLFQNHQFAYVKDYASDYFLGGWFDIDMAEVAA